MKKEVFFDFSKLRGRIIEKYGSLKAFSLALGMDRAMLSLKINNKSDWSTEQVYKIAEMLEIPLEDIPEYFFKIKVVIS